MTNPRSGRRVITGPRAVAEALRSRQRPDAVYFDSTRDDLAELLARAEDASVAIFPSDRPALDRIAGGIRHQGVVAIAGEYPYTELDELVAAAPKDALLVALDEISDPHNFGAIVRSAVAFGAAGIVTLKHRSAPVTGVVVRTSAGATELTRIARVPNLAQCLRSFRDAGFQIVGLAGEGDVAIQDLPPAPSGRVLVVGSEGKGLRRLTREQCDLIARIEIAGPIASLNASVAAAVAIYECTREGRESRDDAVSS